MREKFQGYPMKMKHACCIAYTLLAHLNIQAYMG